MAVAALAGFVRFAYGLSRLVGRASAWAILATVLICAAVAVGRYAFAFGRIWLQEFYVVCFALAFLLAAPWAYASNAHIRVDILSRKWPEGRRAVVEIVGNVVFLIPWLALILWSSWGFVRLSWLVREPSPQAGGLPGIYLVKSLLPLFAVLMIVQSLGVIGRNVLLLAGRHDLLPPAEGESAAGAEL